jgi:hypothetical protein
MDLYHQVSNTVYFLFLFCDRASCFCTSVKHSLFFFFVLFFLWERGGGGGGGGGGGRGEGVRE